MAKLDYKVYSDPTLEAMNKKMEEKQKLESPRVYLGMSAIGHECWRHLFYSFRQAKKREIQASGLKAIEDGYDQEDKTIERLRALPFIELINDDGKGNQLGAELLLSHFKGHNDGVIRGLLQAPKTWHVFEHKAVNQTKFNKLKKLIEKFGEKKALIEWDMVYYTQAQIYMRESKTNRHYLTVTTPGGRDYISCRTEFNSKFAENVIDKAKVIIFDNWSLPAKMSENREHYLCKWCQFQAICHDGEIPEVNCKTCRYSEPVKDGQTKCLLQDKIIPRENFSLACKKHIFNPALIPAKMVEQQECGCIYEAPNGFKFANIFATGMPELKGELDGIYTSKDLYKKIKNVNNFTPDAIQVQEKFNGEIVNDKAPKAWEISGLKA